MKREIKFKGKIDQQKGWAFGDLKIERLVASEIVAIDNGLVYLVVEKSSVCQFTGFKDKKGVEIYEGDILFDEVLTDEGIVKTALTVYFCAKDGSWKLDHTFTQNNEMGDLLSDELRRFNYEVVGNIHDKK